MNEYLKTAVLNFGTNFAKSSPIFKRLSPTEDNEISCMLWKSHSLSSSERIWKIG